MKINSKIIHQRLNAMKMTRYKLGMCISDSNSNGGYVTLSNILNDKSKCPNVFTIYRIAKALNLTVEDLIIE